MNNIKSKKESGNLRHMWQNDFLFEQYPDAILIVNEDGKIEDASNKLLKLFGFEKSEILGKTMEILMPNRFRANHVGIRREHMTHHSGRGIETGMKFEGQRKDGSTFDIDIMLAPMPTKAGKITVCVIRDITEKKQLLANEKKAKETLKAVMDSAPVAIFVLNKEKKVISWSLEAERLFGYKAEEVLGKPYMLLPKDEQIQFDCTSILDKAMLGERVTDLKVRRLHKNGSLIDVSISAAPMYNEDNEVYAAAYSAQDITQRIIAEKKLNQLAYYDDLTGLPNKAFLQSDVLNHLSKSKHPMVLTTIELYGITAISNTLGQSAGEKILKDVAKRLQIVASNCASLYKTCSNEFYITISIPPSSDPDIAIDILADMFEAIESPFEVNNQTVNITANAGISIVPMHGSNIETLFSNTHIALQSAKENKEGVYQLFNSSLKETARAKLNLNNELRKAFENNEFEIYYQPQVRLSNGEIVGAEALLRWNHPEKGLVAPIYFIDALERNPISYNVGKWIMLEAAKQAMIWRENGFPNFRIAVNLFEAQFKARIIEEDIDAVLQETGLPAHALELEITENISHGSDDEIIKPLARLKERGVQIAFDDFGTGYASLSYLVKYPLTRIKIDKSFLENIPYSEQDSAIVHSTIVMAHALGLAVIAEGVEVSEHILFLNAQKCEEAQGYYYSKPLPADEFFEYVKSCLAEKQDHTNRITPCLATKKQAC